MKTIRILKQETQSGVIKYSVRVTNWKSLKNDRFWVAVILTCTAVGWIYLFSSSHSKIVFTTYSHECIVRYCRLVKFIKNSKKQHAYRVKNRKHKQKIKRTRRYTINSLIKSIQIK